MTAPIIPSSEPPILYLGDTWTWRRSLASYHAGTYTLKYTLINASARINITAGSDGTDHLVEVSASTTAGYSPAGLYTWTAYVEAGAERYTVGRGTVLLKAGYATGSGGADARSQARIAYDAARAALASYTASSGMTSEYEIAGRRMKFRSVDEIKMLVNYWAGECQKEQDAERLAQGLGTSRTILTRFGS